MAIFSRNSDRVIPPPADAAEARTPLRILAERYASGEIGREEFQQIRRDLLEQEALANLVIDPRTAALDGMALVDTLKPNATLLAVAASYVAGNSGTAASRILAGLIRALYLDGSVFHFDLLESLDPEQRTWAEGLIKAKLERLIPLDEWDRAYDIVRNLESQTESTSPIEDNGPARSHDWDSMLKEAESFLNKSRSKLAPPGKPVDEIEVTAGATMAEASRPVGGEAVFVMSYEEGIADPPVPYVPVAEMESYNTVTFSTAPPKRNHALRYGVAGLAIIGVVAMAFNALRPTQTGNGVENLPAKGNNLIPPPINVTDGRQQSAGQILVPPAGNVATQPSPVAEKPVAQANVAEKPAPVPEPEPAPATLVPVNPTVLPIADAQVNPPRSQPVKIAIAPTRNQKPAALPAKATPVRKALDNPALAKEATPAPVVVKTAQESAPPAPAEAQAKAPLQVAALAPALRPAPETRPALRPDDFEVWSGGEDSLQLGLRNYQSGNYKDAAENLQKAIEAGLRVKRNTVTAHKLLALSHCALGRESQCRQEFQQALRIDPSLTLGAEDAAVPSAGAAFGSAKSAQGK